MNTHPIVQLFSPFGRMDRRTYCIAMPLVFAARFGLNLLAESGAIDTRLVFQVPGVAIMAVLAWLSFTMLTRRVHDFGQDVLGLYLGWIGVVLLILLASGVGRVLLDLPVEPLNAVVSAIIFLGWIGVLIWAGVREGNPHRNGHGRGGSAKRSGGLEATPTGFLTP